MNVQRHDGNLNQFWDLVICFYNFIIIKFIIFWWPLWLWSFAFSMILRWLDWQGWKNNVSFQILQFNFLISGHQNHQLLPANIFYTFFRNLVPLSFYTPLQPIESSKFVVTLSQVFFWIISQNSSQSSNSCQANSWKSSNFKIFQNLHSQVARGL